MQGHLPLRGRPHKYDIEESYYVPLVSTDQDSSYGLDFDEHGHYVELCSTADVAKTVLTEQQHRLPLLLLLFFLLLLLLTWTIATWLHGTTSTVQCFSYYTTSCDVSNYRVPAQRV